jgi:mRNA interferase RelE/StbE
MIVIFDQSFYKSLKKINEVSIKKRIGQIILKAEMAENIHDIPHIKKMEGFKNFYRIRIGDYRIGVEMEKQRNLRFIVIAHRKEIYRFFP